MDNAEKTESAAVQENWKRNFVELARRTPGTLEDQVSGFLASFSTHTPEGPK